MNNDVKLNVGLMTVVSGRWPRELPRERHAMYSQWLSDTYGFVNVVKPETITVNNDEVEEASDYFRSQLVDAVVVVIGAFTGDAAVVRVAEKVNVPIFVWALPEPPFNGERLVSNALVAATMNCAALKRVGARYHFLYGSERDAKVRSILNTYLKTYHVAKRLRHTLLGMIGYRPTGFYSSTFDETLIRKTFGVSMEEQDIAAVWSLAEELDETEVQADMSKLTDGASVVDMPDGHVERHSRLFLAMRKIIDQFGFNAISLKCWPEMGNMRITPCGMISRFADEKFIIGCESDVNATLSMLVQQFYTDDYVFMTDLINVDAEKNTVLFWHCGQASQCLHGINCPTELRNHSLAGEGVVVEGTLKTGRITVCLFTDMGGRYRLFLATGEAVPTEKVIRGVMIEAKMDCPVTDMVYRIGDEGVPHHYAIVWGDTADRLRALAEYLNIEVIEV